MYMYVATALFLKNTAIKKQILNNGKNTATPQGHINLHFPRSWNYFIYGVFSGEILPYYEFNDWFQCSFTWISLFNI